MIGSLAIAQLKASFMDALREGEGGRFCDQSAPGRGAPLVIHNR